jgi:hypothetical protein
MHTVRSEVAGAAEFSTAGKKTGKLRKATAAAVLVMVSVGPAHAEKIVFEFNLRCLWNSSCASVEKIGTLTLSDSIVDPNRVDFTFAISSQIMTLDRLYLNYSGFEGPAPKYMSIVEVNSAIGAFGDEDANRVQIDRLGAAGAWLDMSLDLQHSPSSYAGSLVLRDGVTTRVARNLDATMFDVQDEENYIYAALSTPTPETTVWYGATVSYHVSQPDVLPIGNMNLSPPPNTLVTESSGAVVQADLPEPGTLGLLSIAAAFLGLKKRYARNCSVLCSMRH